jgi:hypothetical protein
LPEELITGFTKQGKPVTSWAALASSASSDALPVHGQLGGPRRGDHHRQPVRLDPRQLVSGDGLDLRHDQVRLLPLHQRPQRRRVGHGDHMRPVRHLLRGRIGVAVHRDHLAAQPLQLDGDFLAELARAQQHHPDRRGRKRRAQAHELRAAPSPRGRRPRA